MKLQLNYTYAANDDPVRRAIIANMRGKFSRPEKPKVRRTKEIRQVLL